MQLRQKCIKLAYMKLVPVTNMAVSRTNKAYWIRFVYGSRFTAKV